MRLRSNILNGFSAQALDKEGGVLTLPLILTDVPPTDPMEAVAKKYVDALLTQINVANITGIFPTARMPALAGSEISSPGNAVLTLNNTGVTAGTYTKVTVNASGRITAGSQLTVADIPSFSWTKIVNGRPTTLAGYGITDGMSVNSSAFTGSLLLNNAPTQPNHAANKEYVDAKVADASEGGGTNTYKAGYMVRKSDPTTPPGFLTCNGGLVSATTYAELYAAIGTSQGSSPPVGQFYLPNMSAENKPGGIWYIKY